MGNTKRGVVGTGLVRGIIMLVPSSVYGMGAVLEMHKCPLGSHGAKNTKGREILDN
jgi:hypothetical protein